MCVVFYVGVDCMRNVGSFVVIDNLDVIARGHCVFAVFGCCCLGLLIVALPMCPDLCASGLCLRWLLCETLVFVSPFWFRVHIYTMASA